MAVRRKRRTDGRTLTRSIGLVFPGGHRQGDPVEEQTLRCAATCLNMVGLPPLIQWVADDQPSTVLSTTTELVLTTELVGTPALPGEWVVAGRRGAQS